MARDAKVKVMVDKELYEFSIQDELMVDRDDLDTELARQAAHYAWFAVLHERSRYERVQMEEELERLEHEIYLENREHKTKEDTEAALKAKVRTDQRFTGAIKRYQKLEHEEKLLHSIVAALYQRKDLLVTLARSRNLEMSTPSADEVERMKKNLLGR